MLTSVRFTKCTNDKNLKNARHQKIINKKHRRDSDKWFIGCVFEICY